MGTGRERVSGRQRWTHTDAESERSEKPSRKMATAANYLVLSFCDETGRWSGHGRIRKCRSDAPESFVRCRWSSHEVPPRPMVGPQTRLLFVC